STACSRMPRSPTAARAPSRTSRSPARAWTRPPCWKRCTRAASPARSSNATAKQRTTEGPRTWFAALPFLSICQLLQHYIQTVRRQLDRERAVGLFAVDLLHRVAGGVEQRGTL